MHYKKLDNVKNMFLFLVRKEIVENTGWNDKIVVLKKTTLQLYFKTVIIVELTSIQCSRLQPQSPLRYGSGTGSMPFTQASVGAR